MQNSVTKCRMLNFVVPLIQTHMQEVDRGVTRQDTVAAAKKQERATETLAERVS